MKEKEQAREAADFEKKGERERAIASLAMNTHVKVPPPVARKVSNYFTTLI